jgi:hypothetical protein
MFSVISKIEETGERLARIETGTLREPSLTLQRIELQFSSRKVTISIIEAGTQTKQVTIQETIEP